LSTLNLFRFGGDLAAVRAVDRDIETEEARLGNASLGTETDGVAALVDRIRRQLEVEVSRRS